MKNILFVTAILATFCCMGQNKTPRFELGLNLLTIELESLKYPETSSTVANGLQFKTKLNHKYNIRFGVQYGITSGSGSYDFSNKNPIVAQDVMHYSYTDKVFYARTGVERVFGKYKVKPFLFADFGYKQLNSKRTNNETKYYHYNYYITSAIGGGIKYDLTSNVYLSYEATLERHFGIFASSNEKRLYLFAPVKTLVFGIRF